MKFSDFEAIAKHLSDPVKKYVSQSLSPVKEQIKTIIEKINSINIPDADEIALKAALLIDKPLDGKDGKDGENGLDGKSFLEQLPDLGFKSQDDFIKSLKGADGKDGENGKDGIDGINGRDGENGLDGKSFLEQLPDLGFKSQDDFIKSLKGADGKDGENGKDGIDGINGRDGENGLDGKSFLEQLPDLGFKSQDDFIKSLKGADGKDGENGKDGIDGINGRDGQDGQDGKDALSIEILPEINFDKSYERNTYASHGGGLWKSHAKTKGDRGWECIIDGIKDISLEQLSERNFKIVISRSSGELFEKSLSIPSVIYKGVFKDGTAYQKGDTVTWGGSIWHCNQDTTEKPDNLEHKHWTLAVKKGRDAK